MIAKIPRTRREIRYSRGGREVIAKWTPTDRRDRKVVANRSRIFSRSLSLWPVNGHLATTLLPVLQSPRDQLVTATFASFSNFVVFFQKSSQSGCEGREMIAK